MAAWDVSTAVYTGKFDDVSNEIASPRDVKFSSDGSKMYIIGGSSNTIAWQYTLGTPWDVSTSSYSGKSDDVGNEASIPHSFDFSADGSKMYIMSYGDDTVYQYTLGTSWDLSTSSYASKSKSIVSEESLAYFIKFGDSGSKMYIGGDTHDTVFQYTLGTPWDVSTANYATKSKDVSNEDTNPIGLDFSADGSKMYIMGRTNDTIFQYTLDPAWDVSTANYASKLKDVESEDNSTRSVIFKPDGTMMYMVGTQYNSVFQYTLISVAPKTLILGGNF